MTKTLYTMVDLAKALGVSKQAIDQKFKAGRIEEPDWRTTNGINGWTKEQVEVFNVGVRAHAKDRNIHTLHNL